MAAGGMGRVLGLGFLFGAKDDGAIRMTEDIGEGMENMTRAVREVGEESAGISRLGNFINALNLSQLTRVGSALEGLAERAGALSGEISSTSLESHGAQFAQEYRAATAGLGEYRAEVDAVRGQISSLSFNLGVGSEGMLNYATSVARAGRSMDDYGLSMRDIAGLEQAGISNGQELAETLTELDIGFGLGAEGAARLADEVVAIGTRVGSGRDALIGMRGAVEAASEAISQLPPNVELSIDQSVRGMTMLATASQRLLGGTFETAMQGAVGAFQQLAESRQQLGDVFTGMSGDFPALATGISRAFGSVDNALNAMMQSPEQFVMEMQSMYAGMDDAARTRFQREVLTQFPESIRYMIQAGEEGRRTMEELVGPVENAEGALSRMAQGASGSTRTFAESMDLVEESFRSRLDRMARQHYPNFERNVLQRQRNAYKNMTDAIDRAAGTAGVGGFVRTMLAFRRGGFTGFVQALSEEFEGLGGRMVESARNIHPALGSVAEKLQGVFDKAKNALPFLDGIGGVLFDMAGQALPAATALGALGVKMDHLKVAVRGLTTTFGPLVIAIGVVAGIYLLVRYFDQVADAVMNASVAVRDFGSRFLEWARDIDWAGIGQSIVQGLVSIFTGIEIGDAEINPIFAEIATNFRDGFRDIFLGLAHAIPEFAGGIWEALSEVMGDPSRVREAMADRIGSVGQAIGSLFGSDSFLGEIFGNLGNFWSMWVEAVTTRLNLGPLMDAVRSGNIGQVIIEAIIGASGGGIIRRVYEHLFGREAVGEYTAGISNIFGEIGSGIWDSVGTWIELARPFIGDFVELFEGIGGVLSELWDDTIRPLIEDIFGIQFDAGDVAGGFEQAQGAVRGFFDIVQRGMRFMQPIIREFVQRGIPLLVEGFQRWADRIRTIVSVLRVVVSVFRAIGGYVSWWWNNVTLPVFEAVREVGGAVFEALGEYISWWWENVTVPVFNAVSSVWETVTGGISDAAEDAFNFVRNFITRRIDEAALAFRVLGASWEATKTVLASGFRLVAAELNRYIVVPFLRVRGTMNTLAETMTVAFLRVKQSIVGLFQTMLENIQSFFRALPAGLGGPLADALETPLQNVRNTVTEINDEITQVERRGAEFRRENEQTIREAETRSEEARADLAAARAAQRTAAQAAVMEESQRRAAIRAGERALSEATRAAEAVPTRAAVAPAAAPAAAAPPPMAMPSAPSVAEAEAGARGTATRREGARAEEGRRQAREIAEEMMISGFSGQAKRDLTDAMRAALGPRRRQRRGGGGPPPTENQSGLDY